MSAIEEKLKKMEVRFNQEEFVVIDNGTGFIKAGFSGQDLPRLIFPTAVGEHIEAVDQTMQNGNDEPSENISHKVGNAAYQNKDTHTIFEPIQRGIIQDWDKMEIIWEHIFNELSLETKNVNVLMTDSPFNRKENRTKMAEILFEKFKVKSFQVMNTAALSMYSTGKVSGLIAESGEGLTYTVPIFEGYVLPHAMVKLDIAGHDITNSLVNQLEECDIRVKGHAEHIRGLKEQMCSIS